MAVMTAMADPTTDDDLIPPSRLDLAALIATYPSRCPRCGYEVVPSFVHLECWSCARCRRDFVPGAIG